MRERITKAKAFIAVRNFNAAIYELENIRRETSEPSVKSVTNVLLMNSYLEQGDYKRATDLLKENFDLQKRGTPGALETYHAVAAQVVKSARSKAERYRAFGLNVTDRTLPLEVLNDLEKMREAVETVIVQAKENGAEKLKSDAALALLEESTTVRSSLARDDYDARRWTDEAADSREQIAVSRSVITNAVDGTTSPLAPATQIASTTPESSLTPPKSEQQSPTSAQPVQTETKPPSTTASTSVSRPVHSVANTQTERKSEPSKPIIVKNAPPEESLAVKQPPVTEPVVKKEEGPMQLGSLVSYATKQMTPVYPAVARSMRTTGIVRVDVMVNESGEVAEVERTSGPSLLQDAARDAVMKWRFKPFIRDGQPVRVKGFVSFNFSL